MTSPWDDLVTTATLGTDRRPLDVSAWPGRVGELARALPGRGPALLLDAAALGASYRRAGSRPPDPGATPAPPAPDPVRPEVPPAAAERLLDLLAGVPDRLLPEWLLLAAAAGRRAPADTLPALLDLAAGRSELAGPVAAVLDLPGAWLAGFRPDWTRAVAAAASGLEGPPPDDWWTHGSAEQRAAWLLAVRGRDPGAGRAALQQVWGRERAEERLRFLGVLAAAPGAGDEPLLEAALDDRSAAVRREASLLLARLPGSRWVARWRERLAARVLVERPALRRARLHVDVAGLRDLDDVPGRDLGLGAARTPRGPSAAPEQAATALVAAPAAAWDAVLPDPAALVALPVTGTDRGVLLQVWAQVAVRDHHLDLARALLDAGTVSGDLLALLPAPERAERATEAVSADPGTEVAVAVLEVCEAPWPTALAVAATGLVARTRADPAAAGRARRLLDLVAHRADPRRRAVRVAVRGLVEQLPPSSPLLRAGHAALGTLAVRAQMHAELHDGTHAEPDDGPQAQADADGHSGTTTPDRGDR